MSYAEPISRLIKAFSGLPGIGEKSATRLALFILNADESYVTLLSSALTEVKQRVKFCSTCFNLSDINPCNICSDETRDRKKICVVKEVSDLAAIEAAGNYRGLYHVLHGCLAPIKGICPEDIKAHELAERLRYSGEEEIIIALSPNMEGETTAIYISRLLKPFSIKITRIATGIPVGGELEYMDGVTIGKAFDGRREI